ncbi:MAG: stage V sporulation protein T [Clostridia bacterium]|nr:stage V sporulation protein T [Clostridia bacterium]
MKATGIVRRIDDLGRIVIPKEIRRTMRIREGDPLEIYTESDGTVIFKKYSPIGELSEFASQYAESLAKTTGLGCCISDKDTIIAVSGVPKKELADKKLSSEAEKIMNNKSVFLSTKSNKDVAVVDGNDNYKAGAIAPIVFEGDSIGTVMIIAPDSNRDFGDVESKLAEVAAGFLGKTME